MNQIQDLLAPAVMALVAGVTWLLRQVLTNQRKIDMLKSELDRQQVHQEGQMQEIKGDIKTIEKDIKELLTRFP